MCLLKQIHKKVVVKDGITTIEDKSVQQEPALENAETIVPIADEIKKEILKQTPEGC